VHKLGAGLREENSRKHVFVEPVFNPEVALEVVLNESAEFVLQVFS
jgi:hypothetical protein